MSTTSNKTSAEGQDAIDKSLSLCLSGGGYHAAIFHLGALRWLNQCGVLPRLTTISCVSGGSIFAAHLAYRFRNGWPNAVIPDDEWTGDIAEPFWKITNRDIRTWPFLVRFLNPRNWFRPHATVESLRKQYIKNLLEGSDIPLTNLIEQPRFVFCATDMVFDVNWEASRERVGDFQAGYNAPPKPLWTLARSVAASSCFPPIFPPAMTYLSPSEMKKGAYRGTDRDKKIRQLRLTDGGVYDNLGIEPVSHDKNLLVSDGGGTMEFSLVSLPWSRLARYPALLQNAIGKLRKTSLMRDITSGVKNGTYWGISAGSDLGGIFPTEDQAARIAAIRTDMNRFTRAEFAILENHGYLAAAGKTFSKCKEFLVNPPSLDDISVPNKEYWLDSPGFDRALKHSRSRMWPHMLR